MADEFKISALTSASLTAVKLHGLIPVAIAENGPLPIDTYKVDISELIALIENNTIAIGNNTTDISLIKNGTSSVWYVDVDNGDDDNSGKLDSFAFKTVSKAITSATTAGGSNVVVLRGIDIQFGSVVIPTQTVFICDTLGSTITCSSSSSVSGFVSFYTKGSISFNPISTGLDSLRIEANSAIVNSYGIDTSISSSITSLGSTVPSNCVVKVNSDSIYTLQGLSIVGVVYLHSKILNLDYDVPMSGKLYLTNETVAVAGKIVLPGSVNASVILNVGVAEAVEQTTFIEVNSATGINSSVVGFVGETILCTIDEGSVYAGTIDIRVTYAGSDGQTLYDAVVTNSSELLAAINDTTVSTIFDVNYCTISGTVVSAGTKYFYGTGSIGFGYDGAGVSVTDASWKFYVPVRVEQASTITGEIYFTRIFANAETELAGSTLYYERQDNVLFTGTAYQNYWNTAVKPATYTEMGVSKFNENDFSVDTNGRVSLLEGNNIANRFVQGTFTIESSASFVGKGTQTNSGSDTLVLDAGVGCFTIASNVHFLILTLSSSSLLTGGSSLQWYENGIEIGYWNIEKTIFTPLSVQPKAKEHTNDSIVNDDSWAYVIDCNIIENKLLGIRFNFGYAYTASTYVMSLVQVGGLTSSGSGANTYELLVNGEDTIPGYAVNKFIEGTGISIEVIDSLTEGKQLRFSSDINTAISIPVESFNYASAENLGSIWTPPISSSDQPSDGILIPLRLSPGCIISAILFRLGEYNVGQSRTVPYNLGFYYSDDPYAVSSSSPIFGRFHSDNLTADGYHTWNVSTDGDYITVPDSKYFWVVLNMAQTQANDVTLMSTIAQNYNHGSPRISTNSYGIIANVAKSSDKTTLPTDLSASTVNNEDYYSANSWVPGGNIAGYMHGTRIPYIGIELLK